MFNVCMIGDNVLTAANVALKIGIFRKKLKNDFLVLCLVNNHNNMIVNSIDEHNPNIDINAEAETVAEKIMNYKLVWRNSSDSYRITCYEDEKSMEFNINTVNQLYLKYDLCLTGNILLYLTKYYHKQINSLNNHNKKSLKFNEPFQLELINEYITVYARVSPQQKSYIIESYNNNSKITLMCGDGTNDIGALKAAHIGVSVINNAELEDKLRKLDISNENSMNVTTNGSKKKEKSKISSKDRMLRAMAELQEQENDPTVIKLGDASLASAFTARRTSIDSILTIIRQGRCTLVTTIQIYKILALNCLISAYMMSILHLNGLKTGDIQMTANGIINAVLFFSLSRAQPVEYLSKVKPVNSVFHLSVLLSIIGQFIIHLLSIIILFYICNIYTTTDKSLISPDGTFQPNLINSTMFILILIINLNNFIVNYHGNPFTQELTQNIILYRSAQAIYVIVFIIIGEQFTPINDFFQMTMFPSSTFQILLIIVLLCNLILNYSIERLCRYYGHQEK